MFIGNIGFNMVIPFFPVFLEEVGMKENIPIWTGILVSVTFLVAGLVAPVWGSLADRYGKRIMLARSGYGLALLSVLIVFSTSEWHLLGFRVLFGLLGGLIPTAVMLTVSNTPQENMGFALGVINTFIAVGSIMGPFVGGAMVEFAGIRNNFLASAAVIFIATTIALVFTSEKINRQAEKTTILQDVRLVLQNRSLLRVFFSMVVLQASNFLFVAVLPLRVGELTASGAQLTTGMLFSLTGLTLALGSFLFGRVKADYLRMLLAGLFISGGLCVLQGLALSVLTFGVLRFLFGFANAAVSVGGNVLITEHSVPETRGRVFGVLNAFTSFGAVVGPLAGGFMSEQLGTASSFHGCAALFIFAGLVAWKLRSSSRLLPPGILRQKQAGGA
jgi:DHA1 family multidrug resistance protein-like MFS transporter